MLSLFPELLFLSPFAALIIRIALAILIAYDGRHLISRGNTRERIGGVCAFIVATFLLVGAWTQPFALLTAIGFGFMLFKPEYSRYPKSTLALALVMSLSLLVLGAGPFAFDLPL